MSKPIVLGSTEFGKVPRVAAIIDSLLPVEKVVGLAAVGVDLLEIRFDLISKPLVDVVAYVKSIAAATTLPLLGTIRETNANRLNRLSWFENALPMLDAVDIEVDAVIRDDVIHMARASDVKVVVSEHDFKSMPDNARLQQITGVCIKAGAHIVKVAGMPRSASDITRLLRFCQDCEIPMIAIAMGEIGTISRLIGPLFGSLVTYGFLGESVAPGQLPVDLLIAELRRYYPASK